MISDSESTGKNEIASDGDRKSDIETSHGNQDIPPVTSAPVLPPSNKHVEITSKSEKNWWDKFKPFVEIAGVVILAVYTLYTIKMYCANKEAADAAKSAATTAANQLVLGERPWVKIKHGIVSPLTFDIVRNGGPMAIMTLEDTLENVGQTVALNVLSWEDVIPEDADHSIATARKRQAEYCDANRHPDPRQVSGYSMFPHDPAIHQSIVGPMMETVTAAANRNSGALHGKVAFVLVGCVFYRSSFEPLSSPTHQTRFIYHLAIPENEGVVQPFIIPRGVARTLRLIAFPDGFTAD